MNLRQPKAITVRVGIFFVVDGAVLQDSISVDTRQRQRNHIEHGSHYDYWLSLAPSSPTEVAFKSHAYDYYPRGRIVFDAAQKRVMLYSDCCIRGKTLVLIRQCFKFSKSSQPLANEHYQCHVCNKSFIDDSLDPTDNDEWR